MPNKKSQEKHMRQSKKRYIRNRAAKSALYTSIKKVRKSLETENLEDAKSHLPKVIKMIGKSAQKGVIHKRKAARLESRMVKNINKLTKKQAPKPETT